MECKTIVRVENGRQLIHVEGSKRYFQYYAYNLPTFKYPFLNEVFCARNLSYFKQ